MTCFREITLVTEKRMNPFQKAITGIPDSI